MSRTGIQFVLAENARFCFVLVLEFQNLFEDDCEPGISAQTLLDAGVGRNGWLEGKFVTK